MFIEQAPRDLSAWIACFEADRLPVLASTAVALEELRPHEDNVDAHLLAETICQDPLMTVKLHSHLARVRQGREGSDPETVTAALVMLGITPFFRDFGPQPSVEDRLSADPVAMAGFRQVLERSHRAARFALAFAVQRMDHDAPVIHEAALLHEFVELLMWVWAPALAAEVARRQQEDLSLRSSAVQAAVYKVQLGDLRQALMQRWHLPRLLVDISDDHLEGRSAQARNVTLAIRLARHTSESWHNAAIGDDVRDIAALLNMATEPTLALLQDVDGVGD